MPDKKQCSKCGKITDRIKITKKGTVLCGHCIQDLVQPPCQYPNCRNRCDKNYHILCESHYRQYISNGFSPELQKQFTEKLKMLGLR